MTEMVKAMFEISMYGDRGIRIQLGTAISKKTNERIRHFSVLLEKENIPGIIEWIPAYTALSIYYDPFLISYDSLVNRMKSLYEKHSLVELPPPLVTEIPVYYGEEYGPDLGFVAEHNGLTTKEAIQIHTGTNYLIYMMGFSPGFPYLGGMSKEIATPRHASPRAKVPAGAVGIAGAQTGIYSMESPGGWRIIGRTPVKLYNPFDRQPILLRAGNYIRFSSITKTEYEEIQTAVSLGTYEPKVEQYRGE
ncbi:5-oxoprolinase subunit PxpB [Oceanobacillus indicireducens]|uniref:Allophanate hydrolase n=1 Tax=Oceanobacillus indicireducens TaxID=1004261 RepID=A0A918D3B8_9BACI|nr:5-oxoprolinase subunit PxpB [Oceanobacillus indicireducens]GGN61107.1 allophanate hydrolase [Oceanobacillus indicireducens]